MKIGVFSAILSDRSFDAALDLLASLGAEAVEVGVGGYPGAHHCDTAALLADPGAARRWREAVEARGLVVSALSAHANPLHPDAHEAADAQAVLERALAAAELLEVPVVNAFSAAPATARTRAHRTGSPRRGRRSTRPRSPGSGRSARCPTGPRRPSLPSGAACASRSSRIRASWSTSSARCWAKALDLMLRLRPG